MRVHLTSYIMLPCLFKNTTITYRFKKETRQKSQRQY